MKILVLIALACTIASAQPSAPTAEDLYDQGQAAYDAGAYPAAIDLWTRSYELSHQALLLFNIAQARRLSGACAEALTDYRRFVAIDPTAEQRQLADDFIHELEPKCGAPIQTPPPIINRRVVPIARSSGRRLKIAGIATGSTGILLVASGLVLGHHAGVLGDEITAACAVSCDWSAQKDKDATGRRDATIGYALDVVGVAAIFTGAAMYYLGERQSAISVSPRPRDGGAVVSWTRSW